MKNLEERSIFWAKNKLAFADHGLDAIKKQEEIFKGKSVLEIGPGNGRCTDVYRNFGIENFSILDITNKNFENESFKEAESKFLIEDFNIGLDKNFDLIVFFFVIHHFLKEEIEQFVVFLGKHINENGKIFFNFPDISISKGQCNEDGMKTTFFQLGEVEQFFEKEFYFDEPFKIYGFDDLYLIGRKIDG